MRAGILGAAAFAAACGAATEGERLEWTFDASLDGFVVDQTDFEEPTRGEVDHAIEDLPAPLSGRGLRVTSRNYSDDQWVYLARGLGAAEAIAPSTTYDAEIEIAFASRTPIGCVGVGGAPNAVNIKGGVVGREPAPVEEAEGNIGFSIDKGNQSQVGSEAVDLGDIGSSGTDCLGDNPWELIVRSGAMRATSDDQGRLWVYVGTDSGFESGFTMYYDRITVTLTER
jgi:hypothetical protein